jgi:hypothetical protein
LAPGHLSGHLVELRAPHALENGKGLIDTIRRAVAKSRRRRMFTTPRRPWRARLD